MADALEVNTALQGLGLDRDNISRDGAKALADALEVNTALQGLGLSDNYISDAVKQQIRTEQRDTLRIGF